MEVQINRLKWLQERFAGNSRKILALCSKLYGLAAVVLDIQKAWGSMEANGSPTDLKFHVDKVQAELVRDSPRELLMASEDLFYVLYAHLKAEISILKLGQSFHYAMQRAAGGQPHPVDAPMPDPDHLKHIFQACLALLSSNDIGGPLDEQLIRQERVEYVEQVMQTVAIRRYGFDTIPTLQYVERVIRESRSFFKNGFRALGLPSDAPSAMILGTLAEKYRNYPCRVTSGRNDEKYEKRRRDANQEASYAKLVGSTVGEYRRKEGKLSQHKYLRKKLCICFGSCHCARGCTERGHRVCPCNARLCIKSGFRVVDLHGSFSSRVSDGAARIIQLLTYARRTASTTELSLMVAKGLASFPKEVILFRRLVSRLPNAEKSPPDAAGVPIALREATAPPSLTVIGPRTSNRRPGAAWVEFLNGKMLQRSAG